MIGRLAMEPRRSKPKGAQRLDAADAQDHGDEADDRPLVTGDQIGSSTDPTGHSDAQETIDTILRRALGEDPNSAPFGDDTIVGVKSDPDAARKYFVQLRKLLRRQEARTQAWLKKNPEVNKWFAKYAASYVDQELRKAVPAKLGKLAGDKLLRQLAKKHPTQVGAYFRRLHRLRQNHEGLVATWLQKNDYVKEMFDRYLSKPEVRSKANPDGSSREFSAIGNGSRLSADEISRLKAKQAERPVAASKISQETFMRQFCIESQLSQYALIRGTVDPMNLSSSDQHKAVRALFTLIKCGVPWMNAASKFVTTADRSTFLRAVATYIKSHEKDPERRAELLRWTRNPAKIRLINSDDDNTISIS
jgi:hypothetical protein